MAKKEQLRRGLDALLDTSAKSKSTKASTTGKDPARRKPGRPKTSTKVVVDTTEDGTREGEKRATFIVRKDLLEKVKALAYWERVAIKDVLEAALEKHINAHERKHGAIKPKSKK